MTLDVITAFSYIKNHHGNRANILNKQVAKKTARARAFWFFVFKTLLRESLKRTVKKSKIERKFYEC